MSTKAVNPPAPKAAKLNLIGLDKTEYRGRPSTLCKGCGHDSISQRIITAAWELGRVVPGTGVVRLSGVDA